MENDQEILEATEKDIESLHQKIQRLRLETLLSGEADNKIALLKFTQVRGGRKLKTGLRCWVVCTPVGRTQRVTKLNGLKKALGKKQD